jgi:phospholipid transport system substrate-binding protein
MKTLTIPSFARSASPCPDTMRRLLRALLVLGIAALAFGSTGSAAQTPPEELVKTTSSEVLSLIKQTSDRQKLLQLAQEKVVPHFDFARMTQLAVGKSWQQASPAQRESLAREFRELLVRTYVSALSAGANMTLKYLPPRGSNGDEVVVRTQALQPGRAPIAIDYKMEKQSGGEWKVFDVTVDNISLVTNYRDTFNTTIASSGVDGLIQMLVDKNKGQPK